MGDVRRAFVAAAAVAGLVLAAFIPAPAEAEIPALQHLQPGQPADIVQQVPVTVVLVGLEPGAGATGIDGGRLLASQVPENRLRDRTTRFLEREGEYQPELERSEIGLTLDLDYRTVFAGQAFEDAFFTYLGSIAEGPFPGGTIFQQFYSSQPLAAEHIDASWLIDAVAAERWLATNAGPMLGVDTTRPTVFFLDWYGRPDFRFHTYAFAGRTPELPVPFGFTHFGQMVAWGGTPTDAPEAPGGQTARVWFHDVSAGPDYASTNWILGPADLDGDGETDERIPPVWEYGTAHWYRPFDDLTADLAKLLRFVAIDAVFAPSPIYDPATSEPLISDDVQLDLNLFAGRAGHDPRTALRVGDLLGLLGRLDPTRRFTSDLRTYPFAGGVADAFDCMQSAFTPEPRLCFGTQRRLEDDPDSDFFDPALYATDFYFWHHTNQYLDGTRYELPLAVFDVPSSRRFGLSGFASARPPNVPAWTYVMIDEVPPAFTFNVPTSIVGHEVGHHLGLSHLHDAYDPVLDEDLRSDDGPYFFMFAGAETYSSMSYLPNTEHFGQFDRDHLARWMLAARLDNANRILGDVVRSPRSAAVTGLVADADARAGEALSALTAWDLPAASAAAADAYRLVLAAASRAGVTVEPFSGTADEGQGAGVIEGALDPADRLAGRIPAGLPPVANAPYRR